MKVLFTYIVGILTSVIISIILFVFLWVTFNAIMLWMKNPIGVCLAFFVPTISIFISSRIAFAYVFKRIPGDKHSSGGVIVGAPLVLLGIFGSLLFPSLFNATLKQVAFGLSLIIETILTFFTVSITLGIIRNSYKKYHAKYA